MKFAGKLFMDHPVNIFKKSEYINIWLTNKAHNKQEKIHNTSLQIRGTYP